MAWEVSQIITKLLPKNQPTTVHQIWQEFCYIETM